MTQMWCVSLWVGVGVDLLQGHDVVDGFLHFVGMDTESRLQQLERTRPERRTRDGGCQGAEGEGGREQTERHIPASHSTYCISTSFTSYPILGVPQRRLWKEMVAKCER